MKILFISSNFYPKLGGVELVVSKLAGYFSKNDDVKVLTSLYFSTGKIKSLLNNASEVNHDGYKIKRIWIGMPSSISGFLIFPFRFTLSFYNFYRFINKFKPDLINYHFPDNSSIYLALYLLLKPNVNLVTNIHGNDLQHFAKKFFHRIFIGIILNKSQKIIVNSKYMQSELIKDFSEIKEKIAIIKNGVDIDAIQKIKEKSYTKTPYIMYLGRLVHKKGVDVLLQSFKLANLSNTKLLIEGSGEEYASLVKLTKELDLDDKVIFTEGKLNREDMIGYLKNAEFVVMPSRIEPFGIVAIEVMSAGNVIIASNVGGLSEIIIDEVNGLLFKSESVEDLTEKLHLLHDNKSFVDKLKQGAVKTAKLYNWNDVLENYKNVFNQI